MQSPCIWLSDIIIFADIIKSQTLKFLIIININIRFYNIAIIFSCIEFMIIFINIIIININISFYNIGMDLSAIKFIIITIIIIIIVIAINIINSCSTAIKLFSIKFLAITIIIATIIAIINIMNLLFEDKAEFLIVA